MTTRAEGQGPDWADLEGRLLLFMPCAGQRAGTVLRADVAVLDGADFQDTLENVPVFPQSLADDVRPCIGGSGRMLGRLRRGQARPGQAAPWVLLSATEEDKDAGRKFFADRGGL